MRVVFLAPWPAVDPLSTSTVMPHLAQLVRDPRVAHLTLFSCERGRPDSRAGAPVACLPAGVHHLPLPAPSGPSLPLVRRALHHRRQGACLLQAARRLRPDLVICRGTMGIFGDLLWRRLGIPYGVESFEPHAHYMLQTGTWQRSDPKYLVQRRWEERVKRSATALITVSQGYARYLHQHEGISLDRLRTLPCWVDADRFRMDPQARLRLRQQLAIGDRLAVVYVGKFGGIYSPLQDLAMLRHLQRSLDRPFFVIVLTSADVSAVRHQLRQVGFGDDAFFVAAVPHEQVPDYLNAADLALSFINSGPWSFACSAIKHGEYWACGLPVLMPPGVGDEAGWLEAERAGAIAPFQDPAAVHAAGQRLSKILVEPDHRQRIRALGLRERSSAALPATYRWLLEKLESKGSRSR